MPRDHSAPGGAGPGHRTGSASGTPQKGRNGRPARAWRNRPRAATAEHAANATVGFDGLTAAQEAALAGSGDGPGARLRAIGGAYIRYAVAHPARFRVAFGHLPLDKSDPALAAAGAGALGVLRRELAAMNATAGDDETAAVAFAWSAVHGNAGLLIDGHLAVVDPGRDRDAFLGAIADRTLALLSRAFEAGPPG